ncbi:GntR family transcriptional regulator [Alkalibacter rhizosphaerae]|uniref:GntR family transcriptional regulator n=1 Tax=Alkalibacter rhizosphaerae TaxID=2815577 RepID=A0A974XNL8_9FIRM|nr:GntR family transcriptional regulator [Alkalibacter rhizosphaerae]QSX09166.1 GntR family transcriptional regulator [Alkalibacter rhizosphaerae]
MGNVIYIDIVNDIKSQIQNGLLGPGDVILPEYELSEKYGVSRTTLRKSLALLVSEGYIYTIPGKGNYVCRPARKKYQLDFDEVESLNLELEDIHLIDVKVIEPRKQLMDKLKISHQDKVIRVRKVFQAGGRKVEFVVIYLPYEKGSPIVEDVINFANFYNVMEKRNMHFQVTKSLNIQVVQANKTLEEFLDVDPEESLFLVSQEIFSADKTKPISYNEFYIRTDVIQLNGETDL